MTTCICEQGSVGCLYERGSQRGFRAYMYTARSSDLVPYHNGSEHKAKRFIQQVNVASTSLLHNPHIESCRALDALHHVYPIRQVAQVHVYPCGVCRAWLLLKHAAIHAAHDNALQWLAGFRLYCQRAAGGIREGDDRG